MKVSHKVLGIGLLLIVASYMMGEWYFAERFYANTQFAGVNISYLNQTEAEEKVESGVAERTVSVQEGDRNWGEVTYQDLRLELEVKEAVAQVQKEQGQSFWLTSFFEGSEYGLESADYLVLEQERVVDRLSGFNHFWEGRLPAEDASLIYVDEAGYQIQAEKTGTRLNIDMLVSQLLEAVEAGAGVVDVSEAYQAAEVTVDDAVLQERLAQIEAATSMSITLLIAGYEEVITPDRIASWLYVDSEDDELYFDKEMIYDYLGGLNEAYATYDDSRYFESTLRGEVQLVPGTLGWSIDRETEVATILEDLYAGESVVREPMIVGTGYNGSMDDIGLSYIEVDILNQSMFVYLDGELVLSTPVVTGQIGTNTVPGAYSIWNKETPSELVGYNPRTQMDYVQPVQYWMGFDDTGQGIHDANWQSYFGGDTYLTNGSLGCVNTPPDVMPLVFEYAYMGMPVLVFE